MSNYGQIVFSGTIASAGETLTYTLESGSLYLLCGAHPYATGGMYLIYGWSAGAGRVVEIKAGNLGATVDSSRVLTISSVDSNMIVVLVKLHKF